MSGSALAPVVEGVLCVLAVAVLGWAIMTYRWLVRLRDQADTSWARIDVQLKRRHDLIPHLVAAARQYAAHEPGALDAVVTARGDAMSPARGAGPAARAHAEGVLTRALGRLVAAAERHPGDPDYTARRAELADTEERIAYARQLHTGAVRSYNDAIRGAPANLIAGLGGFRRREFFPAGAAAPERLTGSG